MKQILLLLVVFLAACSSAKDNSYPPADLKEISSELSPQKIWQSDAGNGTGKQFLRLQTFLGKDAIYAVSNKGQISAYGIQKGDTLWKVNTHIETISGLAGGGEYLHIGGLSGEVTAHSRIDGKEIWRQVMSSEVMSISTASQNRVIVRTKDGTISALEDTTGKIVWQISRQIPDLSLQSQSQPLIYRDVVVVGLDTGRLLILSLKSGDVVFEKTIAFGRGRTELARMVDIDGQFSIHNDIAYVVTYQGKIAAISLITSKVIWNREASSVNGLTIGSGFVYYTDDESVVWALESHTGAVLWKQDGLIRRKGSAPVIYNDNLIVGDYEGYLHWLSLEDGHFKARVRAGRSAILAPPQIDDSRLYVYNSSGLISVWQ